MKPLRVIRTVLVFATLLALPHGLSARPVDLSIPAGGIGPTSAKGYAERWVELDSCDFGDGVSLPLRLWFDSGRSANSADFGKCQWRAPLLGSQMLAQNGDKWPCLLLCGKILHLWRQPGQPDTWATADAEWTGIKKGDLFVVSRDDGWTMEFGPDNRLVRLVTDSGRILRWVRNKAGLMESIVEERPAAGPRRTTTVVGVKVRRDVATNLIVGLEVRTSHGSKLYTLAHDATPRLTRVEFPDKTSETFAYTTDQDGHPQVDFTTRNGLQLSYAWHQENRTLRYDGTWRYEIEPQPNGFPKLTRFAPGGETEFYHNDEETGAHTFRSADGTTTVRQKVVARGPAQGKLERVLRYPPGIKAPITLYRATYHPANGQLAEEFDALDHKTTHTWELWGATPHSGIKKHTKTSPLGVVTVQEFDSQGNLIATTDALGHVTKKTYDAQNRLLTTVGPDGSVVATLTYTAEGKLASTTDALGHTTSYGYDEHGNRVTTTDAMGQVWKEGFDERGHRISRTDPLGRTWTYESNLAGQVTKILDPDGLETKRNSYDAKGRLVSVTDAAGNVSTTTYDALDRVTSRTDALGRTTTYAYDVKQGATGCQSCGAANQATLTTLPSGRTIARTYDADRHLLTETVAHGTADAATTTHTYDLAGNLTASTDPLGRATRFEYDAENRRVRMVHPDDTAKTFAYDALDRMIAETNELGHTTKRTYDAYGNLVALTDPAGGTTQYLFGATQSEAPSTNPQSPIRNPHSASRRLTGIISPAGRRTHFTHDALGRRIAQTVAHGTPEAATSRTEYDAVGNLVKTISPTDQATTHAYDSRNRRVATTDALNRTWKFVHATSTGASGPASCCGGGNPGSNAPALETHNPDGTIEAQIRDAAGQLVETKDALGHSVKYGYDPDGRLESLTDENGNLTRWTYDPRGKLSAKIYADGSSERYQHNAAGELIRRTRPDDSSVAYTYNSRSRLLSALWDEDKAPASHFAYDAAGRMTQAKNINSTIDRAYDPTGRLAMETQTLAHANNTAFEVGYAYDPDGKLAVLTYPDKSAVHYAWNHRGELATVEQSQFSPNNQQPITNNPIATYQRRPDGLVERLTHGNGVVTTKTYDAVGRIVTIAHVAPDGTVLDGETSRYDALNRRTARIRPDGTADLFDYDPTGQVIGGKYNASLADGEPEDDPALAQLFAYDPAGNRREFQDGDQKTTYHANELNQYSTIQLPESRLDEPQFDASGNLLRDESRTYTWDADSHLLGVRSKDGASARYAYDALHRRIWREDVEGQTTFIHDGWNVITEYAPTSEPTAPKVTTRVWGDDLSHTLQGAGGVGALLATLHGRAVPQPSEILNFFQYDGNGNVILLTDANARKAAVYRYDAFGKTVTLNGTLATMNPYRFSTKPTETCGLVFYGYRYYTPEFGRWCSRDPYAEGGGINLYAVLKNAATNAVDKLGLLGLAFPEACECRSILESEIESSQRLMDYYNRALNEMDASGDGHDLYSYVECCVFADYGAMPQVAGTYDPATGQTTIVDRGTDYCSALIEEITRIHEQVHETQSPANGCHQLARDELEAHSVDILAAQSYLAEINCVCP